MKQIVNTLVNDSSNNRRKTEHTCRSEVSSYARWCTNNKPVFYQFGTQSSPLTAHNFRREAETLVCSSSDNTFTNSTGKDVDPTSRVT